jgi:hypothetical protein
MFVAIGKKKNSFLWLNMPKQQKVALLSDS